MGNNLDLISMLAVPELLACPRCGREVRTDFEDYDIECGDPFPHPGHLALSCYCTNCEYSWEWQAKIHLECLQ